MKCCYQCLADKPASEFYPPYNGVERGTCKECLKAQMKFRRLTNPYYQEYDRERSKAPERKASMARARTKWEMNHPEARRASKAVRRAVSNKRLKKEPCAICGSDECVHGHHKDYSKPLNVVWLCSRCHQRIHATFPELGGHFQAAE